MLPRCDTFKEILFTHRLIAFNESFVPAGKKLKATPPTAVIWHEGIRGRSKEDITSTFYTYFLTIRDTEHVILWVDNCSSQNKNCSLFCFFVYLVNSDETSVKVADIKYFERGHTFMAADSFHHKVEKSLKIKGKVYDFNDYKDAVKTAVKEVNVIEMDVNDFYPWEDSSSQYKLKKCVPRPYLQQMVQVRFQRGSKKMMYKTSFDEPFTELNFLNAKCEKQGKLCYIFFFTRRDH